MRRLGVFAHQSAEYFSWPDQEALEKMPEDIYVTKIVFKNYNNYYINYVQFIYSNGAKSPAIETFSTYKKYE